MLAPLKGILLALANVLVIGIGISAVEHEAGLLMLVALFGTIPALVLGGLLGAFAGQYATGSRHWRTALLSLPAFGLVVLLASFFSFNAAIPIACVPTFIAALVLERWTRQVVPAPVPPATVRSMRT